MFNNIYKETGYGRQWTVFQLALWK